MAKTAYNNLEALGLGRAPYTFAGIWSIPSQEIKNNYSETYDAILNSYPTDYGTMGYCSACGKPIMHHYFFRSKDGVKFALGSECATKVDDTEMVEVTVVQKKRLDKKLREAKSLIEEAIEIEEFVDMVETQPIENWVPSAQHYGSGIRYIASPYRLKNPKKYGEPSYGSFKLNFSTSKTRCFEHPIYFPEINFDKSYKKEEVLKSLANAEKRVRDSLPVLKDLAKELRLKAAKLVSGNIGK